MPRKARMVVKGESAVYHVMSRTALEGFVLGDIEKDYLLQLIKHFSSIYFTEILVYCLMGNHFHVVVRIHPSERYSDDDISERYTRYYQNDKTKTSPLPAQRPMLREKWENLSEFMKEIKQSFSRFYNKKHHRRGFFWSDRFKSVLVENGETLINCLAYVDLNPVRAGIVDKPDDYRWNGLGNHLQNANHDDFLSLDFGLEAAIELSNEQKVTQYKKFVYDVGSLPTVTRASNAGRIAPQRAEHGSKTNTADRFLARTRYFTDSGIIGSRKFVSSLWKRLRSDGDNPDRIPIHVVGLQGLYSLKRLNENIF